MKIVTFCGLMAVFSVTACRKPPTEVTVTEKRQPTSKDGSPKLDAGSDERFRDKRPSPVTAPTPQGWLALPSNQFRLLNYRFGESGLGEVAVGIAAGSVLDNINRWLAQFEAPPLTAQTLAERRRVTVVGKEGVWIEAEGEYNGGMVAGATSSVPGYALAGVIVDLNGRILTVKMTGPKEEVEAAKGALEEFSKSIKLSGEASH
jgi:hypothetical protein